MTKKKNYRFRLFFLCVLLTGLALAVPTFLHSKATGDVYMIELDDDTINPVTAEYIIKAIEKAEDNMAQCLILKLDTPGGLLNSTRLIVKRIMKSEVPVVVYIGPSGSRAGSAGVFITYASHLAAMAPSTNIGAAHPVQMGGKEEKRDVFDGVKEIIKEVKKNKNEPVQNFKTKDKEEEKEKNTQAYKEEASQEIASDHDPMSSKILNDTVAFIKSIAEKRNRNVEWAVKSVTKSASITATEALKLGVIEVIAKDERDLMDKIDGKVIVIDEKPHTLATKGVSITHIPMDSRQKLFNILANPNVAYILMILGFYGLMYEITHPGIGVPGIVGAIFLILAFFSMQTLPTNYAGLALLLLGLVLLISEAFMPGFGLLTLGGVVCLFLGSMLLFESTEPFMRVSLSIIISLTITTAAITLFLVQMAVKAHLQKAKGGQEGMIGQKGKALGKIKADEEGKVFVQGTMWTAVAKEDVKKGDKIVVTKIDGLTLTIKKFNKGD